MVAGTMLACEFERLERSAFFRRIGLSAPLAADGHATVGLSYTAGLTNSGGTLHGGIIATLGIVAADLAVASTEPSNGVCECRPVHLAILYLDTARGGDVHARAEVVRRGRDTAHVVVDVTVDTRRIATGMVVCRIALPLSDVVMDAGVIAGAAELPAVVLGERARLAVSPFLAGAGMEVVATDRPWVCGRLPLEGNDDGDGRVHEGMLATLVDFCGALASYAGGDVHRRRGGSTVALSVGFAHRVTGEVLGAGRLVGRDGEAFTSQVELWPSASRHVVAAGTVSYRIPDIG